MPPITLVPRLVLLLLLLAPSAAADDWPQWRGPERDGVWRETGLRDDLPDGPLELAWRVPVGGGYSGPTVAAGRVYLTDRQLEPSPVERVLCFDAATGEALWTHAYPADYAPISYDTGPRCAVLVHGGRAYSLGAVGHLCCLDAATGTVVWAHDLAATYDVQMPVWGLAAAPIVAGDLLIVPASGKNACVVAFDLATGAERWRALPDRGNYAAPILVEQGGRPVVVCWTGDRVVGLAPADGAVLWSHDFKAKRMPLGCSTPVVDDAGRLFLTGFYDGCVLLQLDPDRPAVSELWRRRGPNELRTDGLHSIISTPFIDGGHIYGVDSYGQLRCLDLATGDRVWEDLTAVPRARWATIHMVRNGARTWMFNERGELVLGELTPAGFRERGRSRLIEPTRGQLNERGGVCWSHPAFAGGHVFARNDDALVCADLRAPVPAERAAPIGGAAPPPGE